MAVFKVHKNESYTVMSNYHLQEKDMSLKAIGLLSIMLSLPEDWDYSISGLCAIRKENETAIKSALNELKSFGYLRIEKVMPKDSSSGRIEYEYNIFEYPQKQAVEKQGIEILCVENQGQLNTNEENTKNKKESKKESGSPDGEKKSNKVTSEDINRWFENIWGIYPKNVDKIQARTTFEHKLRGLPKDEAHKKAIGIYKLLQKYVAMWENQGTEWQYIKGCSTWLNANVEDSPHFKRGKRK